MDLTGVHARGFDFATPPRRTHGVRTAEEVAAYEELWIRSGISREHLEEAKASVARGELAELERRTARRGLDAAESTTEVAERLGLDEQGVEAMTRTRQVFAFVAHGELRYPTWQFTGDPAAPVLPGLPRLTVAFDDDMHPSSILGFMSTPQEETLIDGAAVTPVEWLMRGGDVQELVDILESFLMS